MKKRILSIMLAICMVLTLVPQAAFAAAGTSSAPSVSAYATKDQLMDGTFAPDSSGNADNIGKIVFGKNSSGQAQEWYVLGKDVYIYGKDNTIIFAASPIKEQQIFSETPVNRYKKSDLLAALREMSADTSYFTKAEQGMMNLTRVITEDANNDNGLYASTDVLYALTADGYGSDVQIIEAGSNDQVNLSMKCYWSSGNDAFWLRSPCLPFGSSASGNSVLAAAYGNSVIGTFVVGYTGITKCSVQPASNLDLTNVLFASAAEASYDGSASGTIASGKAMALRLDGSSKNIGTVTYNITTGNIKAAKGSTTGDVSLVVQGNDGTNDWYYSKKIAEKETVNASTIQSELGLSAAIDVSTCKIWLETKDATDGMIYAVNVEKEIEKINTTYATKEQLMNSFSPYSSGTAANIGKLVFGKKQNEDGSYSAAEWYILGKDTDVEGDNTILFAASPIVPKQNFEGVIYDFVGYANGSLNNEDALIKTDTNLWSDCSYSTSTPTEVYFNHYGASTLRDKLQAIVTENFTTAEQGMMNATTVTTEDTRNNKTYTTTDKLYALYGVNDETKIYAGSDNQIAISMDSYWDSGNSTFWLRSPGNKSYDNAVHSSGFALLAEPGANVRYFHTYAGYSAQPAANLNLSNVIFASAAEASSDGVKSGTITSGTAMTLRLDGSDNNIGVVTYNAEKGSIEIRRGYTSLSVALIVQGNDGANDWYYSKKITGTETVNASTIQSALGLSADIDLSSCKIWLEATGSDSMIYAVNAEKEIEKINTTYATKEQLMNSFSPYSDGTAANIGKLVFGKKQNDDESYSAEEWYILGKDTDVEGDNTIIFAANPITVYGRFSLTEGNKTDSSLWSDCTYEANVTEVNENHYGASDLRDTLQTMAADTNYFTEAEQGMMNATTVTTKDTKNNKTYTTTDKLYALTADNYGTSVQKIKAGTNDDKVLHEKTYWQGGFFWLRSPDPGDSSGSNVLKTFSTYVYSVEAYGREYSIRPAANLNLSSVLFASAATASYGTEAFGTIASDKAMTLRLVGSSKNIGRAVYDTTTSEIKAIKGSTTGKVSLVVQGIDGTDAWYYSKQITGTETIQASTVKLALGLPEDTDLSECKIWLETTDSDGMIYAVAANGCSTEAELRSAIDAGADTITLTADITLSGTLNLSDKIITLDLNGHTLKCNIKLADTSAAPQSILTLIDSDPAKGGVLDGNIELTRGSYGSASYLYANGGTVTGKVSMNSYVAKLYCTNNTPTAFKGYVGNYGEIHGGMFYGGINEERIKENTVKFMNGSSLHALEVVADGSQVAEPVTPSMKEGYQTFDGWYEGETKYTFGNLLSQDITLTAKFGNPITYKITCDLDGGTLAEGTTANPTSYTVESEAITLINPEKTGYIFTGWSGTGLTGEHNLSVTILKGSTRDREYKAHYAVKSGYSVVFDTDGGNDISPKTNLNWTDNVLSGVDTPTKMGSTFAGWKYGNMDVTEDTIYSDLASEESVSEIKLTAQWTANNYTVTFDTDGGNSISNKTGVKWTDKVLTDVDNPKKQGFIFEGWKCGDENVTPQTTYSELASSDEVASIELTAQWTENTAPTGKISMGANSWTAFLDNITFKLFFNDAQTVTITASDNGSEAVTIEYLLSDSALTVAELDEADFKVYTGAFSIDLDYEYVIYARLTDESGYVTYINSNGIVLDSAAPVISGVVNGETYCSEQTVTVTEKYIDKVTVNGTDTLLNEKSQFTLSLPAGEKTIVATDKAGNVSDEMIVTVNDGHKDNNNDHECDYCGEVMSDHEDKNKDHKCDYCGEVMSDHEDKDENNICDICGKSLAVNNGGSYVPPVQNPIVENDDNGTTKADLSGTTNTSGGTTTAVIDQDTGNEIVEKAVENKSEKIVIDATAKTAADATTTVQVGIPTATLEAIAAKTDADVTVKTDVAKVTMDNVAAGAVAEQATSDTVRIIVEKVSETADRVEFQLKVVCSDGTVIRDFKGGNVAVTVDVPEDMASKDIVCVYIDDNGRMCKVNGQKNEDGTYTFITSHFSIYALMTEEEADAAIAAQNGEIQNIRITLRSQQVTMKNGKKAIKLIWTTGSDVDFDGVEIFRSTKRYSGYGKKPIFTTKKDAYYNTAVQKGTKYYYKVRGFVIIDGEKIYTNWSTKAWRTVK